MHSNSTKVINDIKSLKIQGATNVLISSIDALSNEFSVNGVSENVKEFDSLLLEFWKSRPTEPALKDLLTKLKVKYDSYEGESPFMIKKDMLWQLKHAKDQINASKDKAINNLVKSIKGKVVLITHCHSSLVEEAAVKLNELGKLEFVVNTETRPLYQGRITSMNLVKHGIKNYHVIDSSLNYIITLLKKQSKDRKFIFVTGADLITITGDLVNKIGTSEASLIVKYHKIPHYVLATPNKVYPLEFFALEPLIIEKRNQKEVWDEKEALIETLNYAFDVTDSKFIRKYFLGDYTKIPNLIKDTFSGNTKYRDVYSDFERKAFN